MIFKKNFLRMLRMFIHFLIILTTFYLTYLIRPHTDLIPGFQRRIPEIIIEELALFAILSGFIFTILGILKSFYPLKKHPNNVQKTLLKVWVYRGAISLGVAYLGQGFVFIGGISRLIILRTIFFAGFLILIFDTIFINYFYNFDETILFLYDKEKNLTDLLKKSDFGKFDFEKYDFSDFNVSKIFKKFYTKIILIGNLPKEKVEILFDSIRGQDIDCYHITNNFFLQDIIYNSEILYGVNCLKYESSNLSERNLVIKRLFDITVSFVCIIILSPLFLMVALLIKLDSKGPVFYKSKRVGIGGKEFVFYKFRSMVQNAESMKQKLLEKNQRKGPLFKIKNDPRITKFGKILRKTSIDELAQLFNILKGDMSLVGPRPHLKSEVENYENRQKRLLSIKPGITGLAQIKGRHSLSFEQEAIYDLQYIQNWNIFFDIYIMIMTLKVALKGA